MSIFLEIIASTFAIVMGVMLVLMGVVMGVDVLSRWSTRRGRLPAPSDPSLQEGDKLLVVLAAAAQAAVGAPVRIRHVHLHSEAQRGSWVRAGRTDIMVSHRVGPRR